MSSVRAGGGGRQGGYEILNASMHYHFLPLNTLCIKDFKGMVHVGHS